MNLPLRRLKVNSNVRREIVVDVDLRGAREDNKESAKIEDLEKGNPIND